MKPIAIHSRMNLTEQAYAQRLELLKRAGEIVDYAFESVKFRLADKTWYTPDFLVVYPNRFEVHEVKGGFIRDDAKVKFKATAEQFPWFVWKMIQKTKSGWITISKERKP